MTQVQPENVTAFTRRWGNERNLQENQRISNQSFLKHVDVNNSYMCDNVHAKCHSLAHTLSRRSSPYFIALDHQYIIIVGFFFLLLALQWLQVIAHHDLLLHVIYMSVFTCLYSISVACLLVILLHVVFVLISAALLDRLISMRLLPGKKEKHFYHVICCVGFYVF